MENSSNPLDHVSMHDVQEALEEQPAVVVHVEHGEIVEIPHGLAEAVGKLLELQAMPAESAKDDINRIPVRDEALKLIEKLTAEQQTFLRNGEAAELMEEIDKHGLRLGAKRYGVISKLRKKRR